MVRASDLQAHDTQSQDQLDRLMQRMETLQHLAEQVNAAIDNTPSERPSTSGSRPPTASTRPPTASRPPTAPHAGLAPLAWGGGTKENGSSPANRAPSALEAVEAEERRLSQSFRGLDQQIRRLNRDSRG